MEMNLKLNEALNEYASAYRTGRLRKIELISFNRNSNDFFREFRFRKKYELREDEVWNLLNLCESVYFTDLKGSYDDDAQSVIDSNYSGELGTYILNLGNTGYLSRTEYERPLKKMGFDIKTELAFHIKPENNIPMNMFTKASLRYLGLKDYNESFASYRTYVLDCMDMRETFSSVGIVRADLNTVYEFFLFVFEEHCKN